MECWTLTNTPWRSPSFSPAPILACPATSHSGTSRVSRAAAGGNRIPSGRHRGPGYPQPMTNASDRTRLTRLPEYGSDDRAALDRLLDEQIVGHVGVVRPDGYPVILPTAIARDDDRLLMHG